MNERLIANIVRTPCAECGKKPSNGCFIKSQEDGGPHATFNIVALCAKHCCEHERIGTLEMVKKYRNVRIYIEHKGWQINGKLWHRDLETQ